MNKHNSDVSDSHNKHLKKRIISFILAAFIIVGAFQITPIAARASEGYSIRINYETNTITVYLDGKPVKGFICSTGAATPTGGTYYSQDKYRWCELKGGVWGQYCQVITGNILFHSVPCLEPDPSTLEYWEYDKLGTTASAGCVRLTVRDAKWIYENCPVGTPVTFYASSDPGPFGKPQGLKISTAPEPYRNWDPTDPDPNNPWNQDTIYMQKAFTPAGYKKYNPELQKVIDNSIGNESQVLKVHWMTEGIRGGSRASDLFDIKIYKANYPELKKSYGYDNYSYVYDYNQWGYKAGRVANVLIAPFRNAYIFDAQYYADRYPDLKKAYGNDSEKLLRHFAVYGINEGRQASPVFDINYYKNRYADLRSAYGNNNVAYVNHFINYGLREGRQASIIFDVNFYKSKYGDLRSVYGNNNVKYAEHYMRYGINEGRQASAVFDVLYYKNTYKDLAQAYKGDARKYIAHFQNYGLREERCASAQFDIRVYKTKYTDLQKAYGNNNEAYLMHYISWGAKEGRVGSVLGGNVKAVFNAKYYANKYPDLKKAFGYDENKLLTHFLKYGIREGRQASKNFSVTKYKKRYKDLRKAFKDDNYLYVKHYIQYGINEKRKGN